MRVISLIKGFVYLNCLYCVQAINKTFSLFLELRWHTQQHCEKGSQITRKVLNYDR